MASLATHFSATLFLVPIGLIRLLRSSSHYLTNPSLFRSKTWYLSDPKWKNLDLYILNIALPIASFSEIFIFLSFTGHPTYRFSFLHQSFLLFLFWVLSILFLLKESSVLDPLFVSDSLLFVFGGIVFFVEYLFIGEGVSGLVGAVVYGLGRDLSVVCGFCCLYLAVRPGGFFAEFCLSCGLVLKGTWFLQAGLCLYTDVYGFKGCNKIEVLPGSKNTEMKCDLDEDGLRGVALVNLLFVGHAIGALLVSLGMFGLLACNRHLRHVEGSGPLLAKIESESALMRMVPEFELE